MFGQNRFEVCHDSARIRHERPRLRVEDGEPDDLRALRAEIELWTVVGVGRVEEHDSVPWVEQSSEQGMRELGRTLAHEQVEISTLKMQQLVAEALRQLEAHRAQVGAEVELPEHWILSGR